MKLIWIWHLPRFCVVGFLTAALQLPGSSAIAVESPGATAPHEHRALSCRTCHGAGERLAQSGLQRLVGECAGCHTGVRFFAAAPDFHDSGADCVGCHSFHDPDTIRISRGAPSFLSRTDIDSGHCRSCHAGPGSLRALSPAHQAAAALYHEQAATLTDVSPSDACLRCHSSDSTSGWAAAAGEELRFSQHASHPFGVRVVPGSGQGGKPIRAELDSRIPLFSGRLECQSCHSLTSGAEDLLIPFPAKYDLCHGCHRDRSRENGPDRPSILVAGFGPTG